MCKTQNNGLLLRFQLMKFQGSQFYLIALEVLHNFLLSGFSKKDFGSFSVLSSTAQTWLLSCIFVALLVAQTTFTFSPMTFEGVQYFWKIISL